MDISRVVQRAINEQEFANKLRNVASRAKAGGTDTPEWNELLRHFKTDSRELAQLKADVRCGSGSSRLVPLIEAIEATGAPEGDDVFGRFGTNSLQIEQLKLAHGCGAGSTAVRAITESLQAMHLHSKSK